MNLVPRKSCFFFFPKKALSLSLDVKCDQRTHKKMMPQIIASIWRKSSYKVPRIIFRCYLLGDEPIILELFFYGSEGVIMGSIMGSQNITGSDYGSNISAMHSKIELKRLPSYKEILLSMDRFWLPLLALWSQHLAQDVEVTVWVPGINSKTNFNCWLLNCFIWQFHWSKILKGNRMFPTTAPLNECFQLHLEGNWTAKK